jgi:ribosomal protein L37AE/L43A
MMKLKPCPFCGSEDIEVTEGMVQCENCNASYFGQADNPLSAVLEGWNERTDPVKKQMLEALKEAEQVIDPIRFGGTLFLVSKTIKAAEEES